MSITVDNASSSEVTAYEMSFDRDEETIEGWLAAVQAANKTDSVARIMTQMTFMVTINPRKGNNIEMFTQTNCSLEAFHQWMEMDDGSTPFDMFQKMTQAPEDAIFVTSRLHLFAYGNSGHL